MVAGTDIKDAILEILEDSEDQATYVDASILRWINDAQRAIVAVRPEANPVRVVKQLIAGTVRQTIDGIWLLDVVRNMGIDGNTPGRAMRFISRETWTEVNATWPTDTGMTTVKEWSFDIRVPTVFYVYPQPHATVPVYLELYQSENPTDLTDLTDSLSLDDVYAPAITEWSLYRFFSRDSENTPNVQRSQMHLNVFQSLIGASTTRFAQSSPTKLNPEE